MTLMRIDPFRELDRLAEQTLSAGTRAVRTMPMEALRRGDQLLVFIDVPGVPRDDIDLTVERNVVNVRVRRVPARQEGDEVIIDERLYGEFARQLFLGDNMDVDRMTADLRDGVLNLTIPVSERSKPRRIPLGAGASGTSSGDMTSGAASASPSGSEATAGAGQPSAG